MQKYEGWPESNWASADTDWKKASVVTAGVDVGAVSSKAAVICDDKLCAYSIVRTGPNSGDSSVRAVKQALQGTGMSIDNLHATVSTGCGRKNVPFARRAVNDITCQAQGASFVYGPSVKTLLDMGGQSSKAIGCNERGAVSEFFVNDKCATGMGRSIEMLARLLAIPLPDTGEISLSVAEGHEPASTTCYAYAFSEAMGLLRGGAKDEEVLAAYLFAVAERLRTLVGRLKTKDNLALAGGLAKNPGIVKRLERALEQTFLTPEYDPRLVGAIGAALLAKTPD